MNILIRLIELCPLLINKIPLIAIDSLLVDVYSLFNLSIISILHAITHQHVRYSYIIDY